MQMGAAAAGVLWPTFNETIWREAPAVAVLDRPWHLALLLLVGCSPYPRYRKDPISTPREVHARTEGNFLTNDYIRLGLILQSHLGKPYHGRSRWEAGLDCSKFTAEVFEKYNKTLLPRTAAAQFHAGEQASRRRLKFGDLVFFRTERSKISHVGVYIDHNEFIHASTSRGVIISNLNEKYWAERFAGARRVLR